MAALQEKEEKDRFFRDLYRLDGLAEDGNDSDEVQVISSPKQVKKTVPNPLRTIRQTNRPSGVVDEEHDRKRRRPVLDHPKSAQQRAVSTIHKSRSSSVPIESSPKFEPPKLKRHMTDLSNLDRRIRGLESFKLKPLAPSLKKSMVPIPEGKQIFKGFVFFLIPNRDDDPTRRFRIHKAIHQGAIWTHEWCEDVTHVIVDEGLDVKECLKAFPDREIPKGALLVTHRWLWESFGSSTPRDTDRSRFQVPGAAALREAAAVQANLDVIPSKRNGKDVRGDALLENPKLEDKIVNSRQMINGKANGKIPDEVETESEDDLDLAMKDILDHRYQSLDPSPDTSMTSCHDELSVAPVTGKSHGKGDTRKENAGFLCMEKHDGTSKDDNPNAFVIEKLQEMAAYHDQTGNQHQGDHFRTTAYRKAIGILRKQSELILTKKQALRIPGIGDSIAAKIEEIVSTGRLRRLEYAQSEPREKLLQLFQGIYGVGYSTASRWITQGHRTLEDLSQKADLTTNQRIGIEHYYDFQQRIPRMEVAQHGAIVEKELKAADSRFQLIIGGSYRRGRPDSGDIDCIITLENASMGHIRTVMMETVIPNLMAQGFFKVALASGHSPDDDCSKWHGASALPESSVWRRLDLLFVPWAELGAALLYFTGNDLFNRSMRLLASRKQMRLNQHGLYADVMRGPGRGRITDGRLLEGHDEKRIFEILGVPYRPPEERNA